MKTAKQAQTVLPFKVEATNELLAANARLVLFGEFICGAGLERWLRNCSTRCDDGLPA